MSAQAAEAFGITEEDLAKFLRASVPESTAAGTSKWTLIAQLLHSLTDVTKDKFSAFFPQNYLTRASRQNNVCFRKYKVGGWFFVSLSTTKSIHVGLDNCLK